MVEVVGAEGEAIVCGVVEELVSGMMWEVGCDGREQHAMWGEFAFAPALAATYAILRFNCIQA